jgi:hypothetical protein
MNQSIKLQKELNIETSENDVNLTVDKVCKTSLQLINSWKLRRVFLYILNSKELEILNIGYYITIFDKILFRDKNILTEKEKEDFLELLDSEKFKKIATDYDNKLRFTITKEEIQKFINSFSVEIIIDKLKNETTLKRVCTLLEEKKTENEKNNIFNKITTLNISWRYISLKTDDIQAWKRNIILLGWVEFDWKIYFEIKEDKNYYVYADWNKIWPFKNISNIRKFNDTIIVNIIINANNAVIDIYSKELYYIDLDWNFKSKPYEYWENLLGECSFKSFNIVDFKTDSYIELKKDVLFCYNRRNYGFLKSLDINKIKWREEMHDIEVKSPKKITYKYKWWFRRYYNWKFKI